MHSDGNQNFLAGPAVKPSENFQGLAKRYFDNLSKHIEKIHQLDTTTGITESNGSVCSRALGVANELRTLGICAGDVIVICSRCHCDQTIVVLACLILSAVIAPLDPNLTTKDFLPLIRALQPKIYFCDLRSLKQIESVLQETGTKARLVHFGDALQGVIPFKKLLSRNTGLNSNVEQFCTDRIMIDENPAFIVQTQGATGPPKLVCLSQRFIHNQTLIFLEICGYPSKLISFFSLASILQIILVCACFESPTTRILTGPFDERMACKLIQSCKIDCAFLGTFYAKTLFGNVAVKDFNLSCLKTVIIGISRATTKNDIRHFTNIMPKIKFLQLYYTTETGITITISPVEYEESLERLGTAGRVMPNYKIRIVDLKTRRQILGPDKYGELQVAGDLMMSYFKDLNLMKNVMDGEYFKTGDLAKYDHSGWLYVVGRIEDILQTKEGAVSPVEIEAAVLMHPFVNEAVVVGNDKNVIACVILNPDAQLDEGKLMKFITDKLPSNRRPTHIFFLDSFPKTSLGKIKRSVLRDELLQIKIERSESAIAYKR